MNDTIVTLFMEHEGNEIRFEIFRDQGKMYLQIEDPMGIESHEVKNLPREWMKYQSQLEGLRMIAHRFGIVFRFK